MKRLIDNHRKVIAIILFELLMGVLFILINDKYLKTTTTEVVRLKKTITNSGFMLKKTDYYAAVGEKINLEIENPNDIKYELLMEKNNVLDNDLNVINTGVVNYVIKINNFTAFNGTIYGVRGLVMPPQLFDKKKNFMKCNEFSDEENRIIDEALEDRINEAGYQTRAGAVAAARFITLEFDRRIPYFYENGRLNNHERKHVDGEGRYYHKGLYISKSKYKDLDKSWTGPGSWGCYILQFEPAEQYGFIKNTKMPNGLDCSGFVSWILLNGGFDVKDTAAGDTVRTDELYDLGEKKYLTQSLIDSKTVKVGDLIAYQGHMAFIAGIDNEKKLYYVVESLPNFKGVVLNKYTHAGLKATFTHIMLMDSVYKNDGKLTNMWY